MARLNTRSQTNSDELQRTRLRHRARSEVQDSPSQSTPDERPREQWTVTGETSGKRSSQATDRPTLARSRSKRAGTVSDLNFDIFADSDGTAERDGSGTPRAKKGTPLKLARPNSMILPLPQQPRTRTSRKSELYNYDKENDPVEEEPDPEPTSLSRNPSDASSTRRSQTRNRSTRQFTTYRQEEPSSESEDDEDDSFNSLDDFIVSDNEQITYYETSDDNTEEEEHKMPTPPPPPRRRLFRGRRPDPTVELEKALRESSLREDLRLEPSVPTAISIPSPTRSRIPKKLFQNDADVSERMDRLKLEDNGPSSQLQHDLSEFAEELEHPSPAQKSPSYHSPFQTPPSSPSKSLLRSPNKDKVRIPPTPYRESADAFWSQEATNNWIDEHSPRKVNLLLQEFGDSDCEVDSDILSRRSAFKKQAKSPSKTALKKAEIEAKKAALARKKSFDNRKAAFAEDFLKVLDDAVSGGQVQKRSEETGGVRIVWSKTLQTTAGRASWKRDRVSVESSSSGSETPSTKFVKHYATIELAERIIDDEDRLINTLAHEYCHLANYMISNVRNNPHGESFKMWGRRCKEALKDHPVYGGRIEVTTKHSYKIDYKYVWNCVDCCQGYGRHSKSIDPTKHRCGKCKGLLQQIKPKPRSVSPRKRQPDFGAVNDMAKGLEEVNLFA